MAERSEHVNFTLGYIIVGNFLTSWGNSLPASWCSLAGWLIGRLVGWFVCQSVSQSVSQSVRQSLHSYGFFKWCFYPCF